MTRYQRRRSDASSANSGFSGDSVISAITMEEDFSSHHSRSLHRFDPKLHSLSEQKRASDPDEEAVKLCLDELRVPGRNNNRFSSSSEGDLQLCAIPRRRLSVDMDLCIKPPAPIGKLNQENLKSFSRHIDEETKEVDYDDEDDDASLASLETLEGSYYAYNAIEMGFDDEHEEYEMPVKNGDNRPSYEGRPRRNYRRRCRSVSSSMASSSVASSMTSSINSNDRSFANARYSHP